MAEIAKAARTAMKSKFTRAEKALNTALTSDDMPAETISRRFNDFKKTYEQVETAHDTYVAALDQPEGEENPEEAWITSMIDRYEKLEIAHDKKVADLSKAAQPVNPAANPAANAVAGKTTPASIFKPERMKFPPFNGNIRKYAKWKEEFETHIKPSCTEAQIAFVLKSHLCEGLREEMDALGGTETEIWERLDERFGNKSRLIDTILAEVRAIEHCDDDSLTLKMIRTIERCSSELKAMKRDGEMNNTTIISMIEEKMPPEMSREWIKIVTQKDSKHEEKFKLLKELLDNWRSRIEYKVSSVRNAPVTTTDGGNIFLTNSKDTPKQSSCWLHKATPGHPIWRCHAFARKSVDERIQLVKENKACFKCLETGHITASCPKTFKCTVDNCNQYHNKLLHKDVVPGQTLQTEATTDAQGVLLASQ